MALNRSEVFDRVAGRVTDLRVLEAGFVVMCGVGSVGSVLAEELAKTGIRRMVLADGDRLEAHNLPRHSLNSAYLGLNKAEAMADKLQRSFPEMEIGAAPFHLDGAFSDEQLDRLFAAADLIVVATDNREAQRRLAARAYALDVPCLIPALYPGRGGEVFVQLSSDHPCFQCWDRFRPEGDDVRAVASIEADAYGVIQQSVWLAEALLDPRSPGVQELSPAAADPQRRIRQLFVISPGAAIARASVDRRPECPGCAVGPSPLREDAPLDGPAGTVRRLTAGRARIDAAGWPFVLREDDALPEITRLELDPPIAIAGETVTARWATANATGVDIDGQRRPAIGTLRIQVNATRTVSFTAVNPYGVVDAEPLVLRAVVPPRVDRIPVHVLGDPISSVFAGARVRPGRPPMRLEPIRRTSLGDLVGRHHRLSDLLGARSFADRAASGPAAAPSETESLQERSAQR